MRNGLLWFAAYAGCVASVIIFATAGGVTYIREGAVWTAKEAQTAAAFFVVSITAAQIQDTYRSQRSQTSNTNSGSLTSAVKKVRVFIVPGHQPEEGGTEFGDLYERNVVVDIADALYTLFAQNPHYEVMVARTKTAWNPILQNYFDTHALEIETFKQSQAVQMADYIASGRFILEDDQVYHNNASSRATLQLYGINKWSSDNKYDITLHVHLNDYAGRRAKRVGIYDGFTIYVPDHQYSNAVASKTVGEAIAARLNAYHATSTLSIEDRGVVEDRELIATGSNNSVDGVALLIEYGYIYEPQFQKSSVRKVAIADYAYQTYLGLQDFFEDSVPSTFGSVSFPYNWNHVDAKKEESGPGIYALQAALHHLGFYPPVGKSFSLCPVSGRVGSCTRTAIEEYQSAHGIEATGMLGPRTRTALAHDLAIP